MEEILKQMTLEQKAGPLIPGQAEGQGLQQNITCLRNRKRSDQDEVWLF